MMKTKIFFSMVILLAWPTLLPAQITREQADAIVSEYLQNEATRPSFLYVNNNTPSQEDIVLTTNKGEIIKAKYACRVYFLDEYFDVNGPFQRRYLLVNENNGNLLEIITNNDFGPDDLASWKIVSMPSGLADRKYDTGKSLYPNPVDDWLTLPCTGDRIRVEIRDLKGACLFSGLLSDKDVCRLNVSFLSAGIYMVNVSGETYKIIKN
jgi:hypothetical protein